MIKIWSLPQRDPDSIEVIDEAMTYDPKKEG